VTHGVWLEHLTWPEAARHFATGAIVVVPVNPRSKEHGHHLRMSAAPVIDFGYYPAFLRHPGSQHLRAESFSALVRDVLDGFIAQGVRRLAIVNTGVSIVPPLRIFARDLYKRCKLRVPIADIELLGPAARERPSRQRLGGQADQFETATMLAIAPDIVHMEQECADYGMFQPATVFYVPTEFSGDPDSGPDHSATGTRGDPSQACAEDGEALLAEMAEEVVAGLRALFPDAPA
jgi:creatinine amidohydrolase